MIGAIAGDIIGSIYEWDRIKSKSFPLHSREMFFTDDTILTVAVADVLINGGDYSRVFQRYFSLYPDHDGVATFVNGQVNKCTAHTTAGATAQLCA